MTGGTPPIAPLSSELRHCTAYLEIPEATWAQPLGPGRAVLTRGVSRRSGSVACIRADASPTEVLALTMLALRTLLVKPIDNLVVQSSDARLTTTVGTPSCTYHARWRSRTGRFRPARQLERPVSARDQAARTASAQRCVDRRRQHQFPRHPALPRPRAQPREWLRELQLSRPRKRQHGNQLPYRRLTPTSTIPRATESATSRLPA